MGKSMEMSRAAIVIFQLAIAEAALHTGCAPSAPAVLLVDNGSKRPAATLALRQTASALSAVLGGREVLPVSLAFSDTIPPAALDGSPARTLRSELAALRGRGDSSAVVVPLFLGPSGGLARNLAECIQELQDEEAADESGEAPFDLRVAPCLVDDAAPSDPRIGRALAARVLSTARRWRLRGPLRVLVVDHGTPSARVNAVRERLTNEVRHLLGQRALAVSAASMERRDGKAYDFNEPLLECALGTSPFDQGEVLIAMAFLLPGRHAGEGGDVDTILRGACAASARPLRAHTTPLLASSSLVLEVLADRVNQAKSLRDASLPSSMQ